MAYTSNKLKLIEYWLHKNNHDAAAIVIDSIRQPLGDGRDRFQIVADIIADYYYGYNTLPKCIIEELRLKFNYMDSALVEMLKDNGIDFYALRL